MVKLTARQSEILGFISENIVQKGYPPTVREIGTAFGIRSPNGVMCHLKRLEELGAITREPDSARAIQIPGGSPIKPPARKPFRLPFRGKVS